MKKSNPKQLKQGSNEEAANTPNTNNDTRLANPYTLSPFGIETPKRQRGHLHTRGGSGREVVPLLLVLLVRLSGEDSLLEVIL